MNIREPNSWYDYNLNGRDGVSVDWPLEYWIEFLLRNNRDNRCNIYLHALVICLQPCYTTNTDMPIDRETALLQYTTTLQIARYFGCLLT